MYSVLYSLKLRFFQFLVIILMILIILNLYSYLAFTYLPDKFIIEISSELSSENSQVETEFLCDQPLHCFISLINYSYIQNNTL